MGRRLDEWVALQASVWTCGFVGGPVEERVDLLESKGFLWVIPFA